MMRPAIPMRPKRLRAMGSESNRNVESGSMMHALRSVRSVIAFATATLIASCAAPVGHTDAGSEVAAADAFHVDVAADSMTDTQTRNDAADAVVSCHADIDCSDRVFCNGAERCMPGAAGADGHGCLAANPASPCLATQTCDEAMSRCVSACDTAPDADHDGHRAIACGGDDCDDADVNRFPGNVEVCDARHDEDCDPCTVASDPTPSGPSDGDHDHDTFVATTCADSYAGAAPTTCDPRQTTIDTAGMLVAGSDCNDANPSVHPTASEVCNGFDDNCNGMTDESLPTSIYYPDCDADNFGQSALPSPRGCAPPMMAPSCTMPSPTAQWVTTAGDCNDAAPSINPGATEACNGIDDNCNGMIDEGVSHSSYYPDCDGDHFGDITATGTMSCTAPVAPPACASSGPGTGWVTTATDCDDRHASAHPGGTEVCDGVDNNCDGVVDNGNPGGGVSCLTGMPGVCSPGTTACTGGAVVCNRMRGPGTETCNGIDDDCNGMTDENLGGPCMTSHGPCSMPGRLTCSGSCSGPMGTPIDTYHSAPAPGGSWDWNCDGVIETTADVYPVCSSRTVANCLSGPTSGLTNPGASCGNSVGLANCAISGSICVGSTGTGTTITIACK